MWKGNISKKENYIYKLNISAKEAREYLKKNKRFKKQCEIINQLIKKDFLAHDDKNCDNSVIKSLLKKNIINKFDYDAQLAPTSDQTKKEKHRSKNECCSQLIFCHRLKKPLTHRIMLISQHPCK